MFHMGVRIVLLLLAAGSFALRAEADGKALWREAVENRVNLALGKTVEYTPAPNYRLTTDPGDPRNLTDGKLCSRKDDRIWFSKQAVGWRAGDICLKLDFGKRVALDKVVLRVLGGAPRFSYPNKLEAYVSDDGRLWHRTAELTRLQPGEKEQHDNVHCFYYEEGSPATMPLELRLRAEARYVLVKVYARGFFFSDEMAVLEATERGTDFNEALRRPGVELPLEGLVVRLRAGKLSLSGEFFMPQFFSWSDMRPEKERKGKVELLLDLPETVELYRSKPEWRSEKLADGITRWHLPVTMDKNFSPGYVFLKAAPGAKAEHCAAIAATVDGKEQFRSEFPVEVLTFPQSRPFEKLHVSLAWIHEAQQMAWPDFFRVWERLGFNAVSAFPMYQPGGATPETLRFFAEARRRGLKLVLNLSPVTEMKRKAAVPAAEMACAGSKRPYAVCPSYFGDAWVAECARLSRYVEKLQPDYVFFDIEAWPEPRERSAGCGRLRKAAEEANMTREDFLYECGRRRAADLKKAVVEGAARKAMATPLIGSYDRSPQKPVYQTERFSDEYPAFIDMAQPSLYVAGRAEKVREVVRACAEKMNYDRNLIVFLTAGTYGEFPPENMEAMVLECFLNGAGGITYFKFSDFDTPADFYYHAAALAKLRPFENLLAEGRPVALEAKPAAITVSALRKGKEMLVLLGNYAKASPEATLTLPGPAARVRDAAGGADVPAAGAVLRCEVPRGGFRLLHVTLR